MARDCGDIFTRKILVICAGKIRGADVLGFGLPGGLETEILGRSTAGSGVVSLVGALAVVRGVSGPCRPDRVVRRVWPNLGLRSIRRL